MDEYMKKHPEYVEPKRKKKTELKKQGDMERELESSGMEVVHTNGQQD